MALFKQSLRLQEIQTHLKFIESRGFPFAHDITSDCRKLHDVYDLFTDSWFECKTDKSAYTNRLLIEYKANVPLSLLSDLPQRQELPYARYAARFASLPSKYNALATDTENLEPSHYLSYLFERTGAKYLLDIRELRQSIESGGFDWFVCGDYREQWRTVAVVVPLDATTAFSPCT